MPDHAEIEYTDPAYIEEMADRAAELVDRDRLLGMERADHRASRAQQEADDRARLIERETAYEAAAAAEREHIEMKRGWHD